MSDAKQVKQSVARCKYGHDYAERFGDHPIPYKHFECSVCGFEPKEDSAEGKKAEAILHLRKVLKPGDTVYTVLRHVSRSGMSRNIDLYYIAESKPVRISAYVGHAIGTPQSLKNWERSQGLTVGGCGMDMGFHLVYALGRVLYPHGFACVGERCQSNDHSNDPKCRRDTFVGQTHTDDGGYALRKEWL